MDDAAKASRQAAIEEAAFALLTERGFEATSMLAVAKAARASNETLYRWYGDKVGLFGALVARNAAEVARGLEGPLDQVLIALLTMLTGPRAVALNRAAAADASGALGEALAKAGRETVLPRLEALLGDQAELLLRLVIGDWQIRRATGAMAQPDAETIAARVAEGVALWHRLRD